MHTRELMKTAEFTFTHGEEQGSFADLFPDFSAEDRVGILSWRPGGILEGAPLFLAAIGAFYEELLQERSDFYEYPDIFALHVGGLHGYHGWLDIWPERREVVLPADPNAVVGQLSDLGVTRLIIQDSPTAGGILEKESVTQLARRLRTILRVGGQPTADSWSVTPSHAAADLIRRAASSSAPLMGQDGVERAQREADQPRTYTPIGLDEAIRRIGHCGTTPDNFGMSEEYRRAHGVDQTVLERHTLEVRALEPVSE